MKKIRYTTLMFLLSVCLCGPSFAQKGEATEKKAEGVQPDVLIETFFTKRTGDLPEMLGAPIFSIKPVNPAGSTMNF